MPTPTNIDHNKKYLYVHVPKCAGKLVELYFFNKNPGTGSSNHYTIQQIIDEKEPWLKEEIEDYYIFSTVRNPWDRVVSGYFAERKRNGSGSKELSSFKNFVNSGYFMKSSGGKLYETYLKYNGTWIDNIFRIEDINTENCPLQMLGDKFNVELPEYLDVINQANLGGPQRESKVTDDRIKFPMLESVEKRKPYEEYYVEETREKVYNVFVQEIEFFDYKF